MRHNIGLGYRYLSENPKYTCTTFNNNNNQTWTCLCCAMPLLVLFYQNTCNEVVLMKKMALPKILGYLFSVLFSFLLALPVSSFAALSDQDKANCMNIHGGAIKPETYITIFNFCNKNDTNIDSCLLQLKAQVSEQKSVQNQNGYSYCCRNVSGQWGDHHTIDGIDYCIWPCHY